MTEEYQVIPKEIADMLKAALTSPVVKILIVVFFTMIGILSVKLFHLSQDNPIEMISEEVIKDITGVTVDLTPQRKEK